MPACKDCIHYESCRDTYYNDEEQTRIPFGFFGQDGIDKACAFFKDRSKFIELPCKLGDRLYAINGKGEIKSWKIICIRAIKSSIQWNPEHIEYTVGCEKSNGIMWIHLDKTKNVYFSFEEAEQALMNRKRIMTVLI